jgi:hypothetical protein
LKYEIIRIITQIKITAEVIIWNLRETGKMAIIPSTIIKRVIKNTMRMFFIKRNVKREQL